MLEPTLSLPNAEWRYLALLTSIGFSFSFVLRTRSQVLIRRLALTMVCVTLAGGVGVLAGGPIHPVLQEWVRMLIGKSPQS
jgi:hypothetical protein